MAHGLVTTAGTVSHTGVGGLTLGAGFGRVARRFGLALDNVRAVETVSGKGEILRASAQENLRALLGYARGRRQLWRRDVVRFHAASDATEGARRHHPVPDEPGEERADVLFGIRGHRAGGSVPERRRGEQRGSSPEHQWHRFHGVLQRPGEWREKCSRPIRSAARPCSMDPQAVDYVALQKSGDLDERRAIGSYTKTGFIKKVSPQLVDSILAGLEAHPERATTVGFQHCGGAISRVAADATAFPHRDIHATVLLTADWPAHGRPGPARRLAAQVLEDPRAAHRWLLYQRRHR